MNLRDYKTEYLRQMLAAKTVDEILDVDLNIRYMAKTDPELSLVDKNLFESFTYNKFMDMIYGKNPIPVIRKIQEKYDNSEDILDDIVKNAR